MSTSNRHTCGCACENNNTCCGGSGNNNTGCACTCTCHCNNNNNNSCGCNNISRECFHKMRCCSSVCRKDCRDPNQNCSGIPLEVEPASSTSLETCCDQSGCCGLFPASCRNPFWPSFAKPEWLCCHDLYS